MKRGFFGNPFFMHINSSMDNSNFLQGDGFKVIIDKYPSMKVLCQGVYLPGLMLGEALAPSPFIDVPQHGDKLTFEKLAMTIAIDEDLNIYREVNQWIKGMSFPENFQQYRQTQLTNQKKEVLDDIYSDISVSILNNQSNPNIEFVFYDAFPIMIGGFQLSTQNPDNIHITTEVSFTFRDYVIKKIGEDTTVV